MKALLLTILLTFGISLGANAEVTHEITASKVLGTNFGCYTEDSVLQIAAQDIASGESAASGIAEKLIKTGSCKYSVKQFGVITIKKIYEYTSAEGKLLEVWECALRNTDAIYVIFYIGTQDPEA
jgi:hypothetical protein